MNRVFIGCVAAVALVTSVVRADRDQVEAVMRSMEKAVLAGDQAGYLNSVVPASGSPVADAIFRKEQENWAKDLGRHAVDEFTLAISPDRESTFDATRAEFELVLTWRMKSKAAEGDKDGEVKPRKARSVSYPAAFVRADASSPWLFAGERWVSVEAPGPEGRPGHGVKALCFEGFEEVAKRIVNVMPEVRAHVEEGFELTVNHRQDVKLYPSMRHLQESIYLSYVDGLSGWNEPGESIKLYTGRSEGEGALKPLLAHEFGHVCTFEMGEKATDAPWWMVEGVAELSAEGFSRNSAERAVGMVERWSRNGRLAAWSDITDFRNTPGHLQAHVYTQGQHMVGYISQRFGRPARNAWVRAMAQGHSLDEATQQALKIPFRELDAQWRASLPQPEAQEPPSSKDP